MIAMVDKVLHFQDVNFQILVEDGDVFKVLLMINFLKPFSWCLLFTEVLHLSNSVAEHPAHPLLLGAEERRQNLVVEGPERRKLSG